MTPARTHFPINGLPLADRPVAARRFLHREVRVHMHHGIVRQGLVLAVARLWGYGNTRQQPSVLVLSVGAPRAALAISLSRITHIEELH